MRDGANLAVNLIAWHPERSTPTRIVGRGIRGVAAKARAVSVVGPHPDAVIEDGQPPRIVRRESDVAVAASEDGFSATLELPPCSVTTVLFASLP